LTVCNASVIIPFIATKINPGTKLDDDSLSGGETTLRYLGGPDGNGQLSNIFTYKSSDATMVNSIRVDIVVDRDQSTAWDQKKLQPGGESSNEPLAEKVQPIV